MTALKLQGQSVLKSYFSCKIQEINIMDIIRVAYIATSIQYGGAERVCQTFLKLVDRSKFEINPVLLVRPWEEQNILVDELQKERYFVQRVPVARSPRSEGRDYFRIYRCYKHIFAIIKTGNYNLIHTNGYFADLVGIPIAKLLKISSISMCHGYITDGLKLGIYNALDRMIIRFADRVIAVSESIKKNLVKNGVNKSKITVIQNAVELKNEGELYRKKREVIRKQINLKENDITVGYIGRISKEKGVNYLIEACSMLMNKGIIEKVIIIGDGICKEELENLARQKGIGDRVYFVGFQKDIGNWLPAIDIFVLPSLTEGTPLSLLEAMSYGIPIVASAVGGVPQVVQTGKNGILVNPGRSDEIADAVCTLSNNEALRNSLGEEGKRAIEMNYNAQQWVMRIEDEYIRTIFKESK